MDQAIALLLYRFDWMQTNAERVFRLKT